MLWWDPGFIRQRCRRGILFSLLHTRLSHHKWYTPTETSIRACRQQIVTDSSSVTHTAHPGELRLNEAFNSVWVVGWEYISTYRTALPLPPLPWYCSKRYTACQQDLNTSLDLTRMSPIKKISVNTFIQWAFLVFCFNLFDIQGLNWVTCFSSTNKSIPVQSISPLPFQTASVGWAHRLALRLQCCNERPAQTRSLHLYVPDASNQISAHTHTHARIVCVVCTASATASLCRCDLVLLDCLQECMCVCEWGRWAEGV